MRTRAKIAAKLQKNMHICKKNAKKFAYIKKKQYLCTRFSKNKIGQSLLGLPKILIFWKGGGPERLILTT